MYEAKREPQADRIFPVASRGIEHTEFTGLVEGLGRKANEIIMIFMMVRGFRLDNVTTSIVWIFTVAPRAGAWIETSLAVDQWDGLLRRPSRGGVD